MDPRYSGINVKYTGPVYTKPGAPTAKDIVKEEALNLSELKDFIAEFNKKNTT